MRPLALLLPVILLASCATAYYAGMEKAGFHKRDILVSRVKKAKNSQVEAKEQFQSALDEFIAVTGYEGGSLEKKYRRIESAYKRASARAEEVKDRNDDVAGVGKALFREWDKEIGEYQSADLRFESKRQRDVSQRRFDELMTTMRRAEARLDPVLAEFRDHVLFLKHNLNARAVAALEGKAAQVRIDVGRLIREMEASIAEADAYIRELNAGN
ncbi:MAG: DUF2959 domain-containing protein [Akkermansiaceae bacterium]|nr:DUF2959 domain-containing protein [Akkermansiaceae bacterium]NNM28754.1 DUF2959 domain-containing protein [Akkermansiaceae bacterium]